MKIFELFVILPFSILCVFHQCNINHFNFFCIVLGSIIFRKESSFQIIILLLFSTGSILAVGLFETVKGGYSNKTKSSKSKGAKKAASAAAEGLESGSHSTQYSVHLYYLQVNGPGGGVDKFVKICEGCPSIAWIADLKFHKAPEPDGIDINCFI